MLVRIYDSFDPYVGRVAKLEASQVHTFRLNKFEVNTQINKIRGSEMENDAVPLYENGQHVYPTVQLQKYGENNSQSSAAGQAVNQILSVKPLLGPDNTITVCNFCHASIKTAVKYTNTTRTHIAAALWGLLCCLCCVMYGSDSAKNTDHYCPNCQRYLGTYEK